MREKVIRGEKEYCEFVLIIGKGFPKYWGWLRGVVRVKSRRLEWKAKERKFLWRDTHTNWSLARNPGKGSCSYVFLIEIVITVPGMIMIAWAFRLLHCFCEILDSAQKSPGGHACAAKRHISVGPVLGVFVWVAWRWVVFRQAVLMAVAVLRVFLNFFVCWGFQ